MADKTSPVLDRHAQRVKAVLALFRGEPAAAVSAQYQIGRSNLYKFRSRALTAIRGALTDRRRGPRQAHNRVAADTEAKIVALCQRHPTLSSYAVHRRGAPASPRTIQRIRARHGLARFSKRDRAMKPRRSLPPDAHAQVSREVIIDALISARSAGWDVSPIGWCNRPERTVHFSAHLAQRGIRVYVMCDENVLAERLKSLTTSSASTA